jgi:signal transduction histidine kinase
VRPPRLTQDLPVDLDQLDEPGLEALPPDEVTVSGQGVFRRVVVSTALTSQGSRQLAIPVWLEPQTLPVQAPGGRVTPVFGPISGLSGIRPFRPQFGPDYYIRVFVHAARPRDVLDDRLAADAAARDEELQQVHRETRDELHQLRTRLAGIAAGSFLALVVGGWLIVARGLAPVRTLSEAVSRVSEKDFALPVAGADLSVELAPIHARLTQTLDQLRAAFAREKEAVADISHELRTPIASLLATIDVTLRKPRTPEQYRTTLEDCRGIAKQLGQLVERIMTLASLDAGAARGTVSRVDAAELVGGCATVIRPLAEAHGLTFSLTAVGPAELDTDADRLREVLMNLLHNAVEYNRPAGRVELAVRAAGGRVIFEVRDTGIGMKPEVQAKIFERFYRADASRTATGVHAGLGLAIVKEYVDRLGGKIEVETTPGEGSLFRVSFPAAPAGQP